MLIFVLQTIWLYIKELAGKDLDLETVLKFLLYFAPKLIPLVLPLTILLSSIMVFGNFAENYEFAAMKSTGISLQRAMAGLSVFIIALSVLTFFFSNNVIPWAEYNSYNLRKNIAKLKPATFIAEGQFNQVGEGLNIKVEKKTGEKGEFLEGVVIHQKSGKRIGNHITIIAETGELIGEEDSDILKLILYNGYYYDDTPPKDYKKRKSNPFIKSYFKEYIKYINLSDPNAGNLEEKNITDKYSMLDVNGLKYNIDSLKIARNKEYKEFNQTLYNRTNVSSLNLSYKKNEDSIYKGDNILNLFKARKNIQIVDLSLNTINSTKQMIGSKAPVFKAKNVWINKHYMALHEKFALGFACIILFFVGAPLGALIRKGGIGLPMVIAILLFLTYHFIGIFAKNSAKDGSFNPILATWFSTLIMLPLSIYLTKRATADRGLFESDAILEPLKKLFGIKSKLTIDTSLLSQTSDDYNKLVDYNNTQLVDIVNNYRQYNYIPAHRNTALSLLKSRGVSEQELKISGKISNNKLDEALRLKGLFEENSKLAFILYTIALLLSLGGKILANNGFSGIGNGVFVLGILIQILFFFALFKSFADHTNLYKHLGKDNSINSALFILLGLPLYFVNYFFQKKKIKRDLNPTTLEDDLITPNKDEALAINDQIKNNTTSASTPESKVPITLQKDYLSHSNYSVVFYSLALVCFILFFVLKNNKLPLYASASIQLSGISLCLYSFYFIKTQLNLKAIFQLKNSKNNLLQTILSYILYPVFYIKRKNNL